MDWNNRQISFDTKFDKRVVVDFNDKLEAHLKDMWRRRNPNSDWLFPSPRPGDVTPHLTTPQKTLPAVANDAGLPNFNPHDLRHSFASECVMAGIDFMTIARWLGHSDGGILIGKVYGHLSNEHAQAAAKKINFGAAATEAPAAVPLPQELATVLPKFTAADLVSLLQQQQTTVKGASK